VSAEILSALAEPFPPEDVSWRVGTVSKDKSKGMALAYIDSRDVQARLDRVVGHLWQDEIVVQPNGLVCCRIGIYMDGQWIWRMDGTAALSERTYDDGIKGEQAREMDHKGAASDAFKRAAVKWGIGRYLYSIPSPWIAVNEWKQIEPGERGKLLNILRGNAGQSAAQNTTQPQSTSAKTPLYFRMERDISGATSIAMLADAWSRYQPLMKDMPRPWIDDLTAAKDDKKSQLAPAQVMEAAE
jgi:hypothetical protein